MSTKFVRLNRESDPPAGKMASPTPQYWDRETEQPEDVEGLKGAPFAVLLGPNGQPISDANRLPVKATLSGHTEVITLVDAEAIREESPTAGVATDWIPLDGYRDWEIYVSSTLDAIVRFSLNAEPSNYMIRNEDGTYEGFEVGGSGQRFLHRPEDFADTFFRDRAVRLQDLLMFRGAMPAEPIDRAFYKTSPKSMIQLRYRVTQAPSSGALSIWFVGRRW